MGRDLNPRWRFCRALPSLLATHAEANARPVWKTVGVS
jgi:hypothetical protein